MISRMARCSAQPVAIPSARFGPMPANFPQPMWFCFDEVEHLAAEGPDKFAGISRTNATDHSGAEIFFDSGGRWAASFSETGRGTAGHGCDRWPIRRSLAGAAAWPTTLMGSRLPRAFTCRTQKPLSSL
jgi:hypothetical protein